MLAMDPLTPFTNFVDAFDHWAKVGRVALGKMGKMGLLRIKVGSLFSHKNTYFGCCHQLIYPFFLQ